MSIADKYGIPVVEDAAEGMGSRFNGQVLGTLRQVRRAKRPVSPVFFLYLFPIYSQIWNN